MQKIGRKITVTVPDEILEEIEKISKKFDLSKAEVSRILIETGLDTFNSYHVTGVIKIADIAKKIKIKFESFIQKK
jgi:rRNA maturation endonuclease Nob1